MVICTLENVPKIKACKFSNIIQKIADVLTCYVIERSRREPGVAPHAYRTLCHLEVLTLTSDVEITCRRYWHQRTVTCNGADASSGFERRSQIIKGGVVGGGWGGVRKLAVYLHLKKE